jgi:catechol 2,3-dioxygenase-like lactoylglutathione lyase family enzyme
MIFGAHVILYSRDAEADRAFLRDVLGFSTVDAGHGWLIFALLRPRRPYIPRKKMAGMSFTC